MIYFKATLLDSKIKANNLSDIILEAIKEKKPQSIKQLILILKETLNLQEKEILDIILKMQTQGTIKIEDNSLEPRSFVAWPTGKDLWYRLTIAAGAIATTLVFTIPENLYPWIYVRNFFGILFVFFLPGYAFVKALFPANLPGQILSRSLETIERMALSVGLSIALVSIVGLLLYYSTLYQSLPVIVASLFVITSIFATIGKIRYNNMTRNL